MRWGLLLWLFFLGWMWTACTPPSPSDAPDASSKSATPIQTPLQKAVQSVFTPQEGAMFGPVFPSASCEAALNICPANDGCDAVTTDCKVAENSHFKAHAHVILRNRRFEWMRVDVYPTPQSSSDSLFNALHKHFCTALYSVEARDGFAHWIAGADTSRYEVTLVEQRDEYQNTYLAVSYFPRGR